MNVFLLLVLCRCGDCSHLCIQALISGERLPPPGAPSWTQRVASCVTAADPLMSHWICEALMSDLNLTRRTLPSTTSFISAPPRPPRVLIPSSFCQPRHPPPLNDLITPFPFLLSRRQISPLCPPRLLRSSVRRIPHVWSASSCFLSFTLSSLFLSPPLELYCQLTVSKIFTPPAKTTCCWSDVTSCTHTKSICDYAWKRKASWAFYFRKQTFLKVINLNTVAEL